VILSVVQSHYKGEPTREKIYAAGESVAAWLGLDSWVEVVTMQNPESVDRLRKMILEKAT
jgi:hypothetical protein